MSAALRAWRVIGAAAAPAASLLLRIRVARGKESAERLAERRGRAALPRPAGRLVWMHAASVGESVSVLPVLEALAARADPPAILLTTGTKSSAALLGARLQAHTRAGDVRHQMVPLDVPRWVARFLDHWRPDAAVFVESELWPNMLAACRARGIPRMLLNARLSARSARAWARAPALAASLLGGFDRIWARSGEDRQRIEALGGRVQAEGDLKSAAPPLDHDAEARARIEARLGARPRWLAASTHPGEEEIVADAARLLAATCPGLLTIIAPRHPERGAAIAAALGGAPRRAREEVPGENDPFWVWDRLGEPGLFYRIAPIVFVGRSLGEASGGQNPLEPARLGCAIASGPATANFVDAVAALRQADALVTVRDSPGLAAWVTGMLASPETREAMGRRAREAARGDATLPARAADMIMALLQ